MLTCPASEPIQLSPCLNMGCPSVLYASFRINDLLDKIQRQKHATPVPGYSDLSGAAEILEHTKPNAVVLEKSSCDEGELNN